MTDWHILSVNQSVNLQNLNSINGIVIIISLFIQQQNSTNTVTNVDTNEDETGMTRLIALMVTPVY